MDKCKFCNISINVEGKFAKKMLLDHEDMCWRNPKNKHHGGCIHMERSGYCPIYGDVIPNRALGRCEQWEPTTI
jgi:hypothetical protein